MLLKVIASASILLCLNAQADSFNLSTALALDYWDINSPAETSARYLPDYSLPEGYSFKPFSQELDVSAGYETALPSGYVKLNIDASLSTLTGQKIKRADIDYRLGNKGVRLGILPYRISWCRSSTESVFISEPDVFCRFHGLNELAQGAFGIQTYSSRLVGDWMLDSMLGYYKPMIASQRDALGPYVSIGPTVKHDAHGLSVNALHLPSSLQLRFGWLNTIQHQDPSNPSSFQRRLKYDSYYLAAETNILPSLTARVTSSGYIGNQLNSTNLYNWNGNSTTVDLGYRFHAKHGLIVGYSEYSNRTVYPNQKINLQNLVVKTSSVAYSYQVSPDLRLLMQYTATTDWSSTRTGKITYRKGDAIGVRALYVF